MSVYVSGWLDGESTIRNFFRANWGPSIDIFTEEPTSTMVQLLFHVLSEEAELELQEMIPRAYIREFYVRFGEAANKLLEVADISLEQYFMKKIAFRYISDLEEISYDISDYLQSKLNAYQVNPMRLADNFVNYIFYGTWHRPKSFRFIIDKI